MSKNTRTYVRQAAALLMALSLLCSCMSVSLAQSVTGVKVRSALLDADTITADGMVRVYLASLESPTYLNLTIGGGYSVGTTGEYLSDGTAVAVSFSTQTGNISLSYSGKTLNMGKNVTLRRFSASSSHGIKILQSRESGNPFPGDLELRAVYGSTGYQLYVIVHVYIENYLYGVLPYEMGNSTNVEALKAQAVAARTYTVRMMKNRASGMYDVKDTTSDQVYRGTPSGNANCVAAVDATKGIVLMYGSSYITTYYSSSNGGQTETSRTVSTYSYLPVKDDPFDYANPSSTVKKKTVYANLQSASNNAQLISLLKTKAITRLNQIGYGATQANTTLGTLTSITPHTPKYVSPSRLYTKMDFTFSVSVNGSSTAVTVTCDIFNELESILSLGIQSSANELWSVSASGNSFEIQARRYGHGMGMSQRGAMYMAKLGYTYDQILGFYYEGCTRVKHSFTHTILSPSGDEQVNVEKPAEDENTTSSSCYGIVKLASAGSSLAIRNARSYSASVIGSASNGAKMDVLYSDGTWCLISFGGLHGYVPASSLTITGTPVGTDTGATSILGFVTVTASDFVNLRAGESTGSQVLGTAPAGAVLTVFSTNGNWAKVQYNALSAYVHTGYVSSVSQTYPGSGLSSGTTKAVICASDGGSVNLRASASTGAQILGSYASGTEVTVHSDDGSWSYVTVQGMTGYIMSAYLQTADEEHPQPEQPQSPVPEGAIMAVVATQSGSLNMCALPQAGSQILTTIPRGMEVYVTQYGASWSGVYYNGLNGYVMTSFLSIENGNTVQPPAAPESEYAVVITPSGTLNLRTEPQTGSGILLQIRPGEVVNVHHYGTDWCNVSYQGITGYVMTQFLSFDAPETDQPETEDQPEQDGVFAVVSTPSGWLNLRLQPSSVAGILAQIPQYATISVLQTRQDWCLVEWQGNTGYVMTSFLTFVDDESQTPEPSPDASVSQKAYVYTSSGSLNLRSEPSGFARILGTIPRGGMVEIIAYGDLWSAVSYGGSSGYVMTQYLTFDESAVNQPETSQPSQTVQTMWVNTSSGALNLRAAPYATADVIAFLPQYAAISCYGSEAGWSYVSYQGQYGYVSTQYLATGTPPERGFANESNIVNGLDITMQVPYSATYATARDGVELTLWETCEETGNAILLVPPYERVEVVLLGDTWCRVEYQGMQGYCKTEWLSVL